MLSSIFYIGLIYISNEWSFLDVSSFTWRIVYDGLDSYTLSNMRNISGGGIRCPCKRCKNKKVYRSKCCNSASSTKRFHGEILVLVFLWDHGR